jgi:hypothetical protein
LLFGRAFLKARLFLTLLIFLAATSFEAILDIEFELGGIQTATIEWSCLGGVVNTNANFVSAFKFAW